MTPNVAAQGHSFKGAFAYYLHDKGQDEAGQRLTTSERVGWTETRNLATDGPHTACRIMIATASQADELKAAAGIKATGRKAKSGAVYSYSLSWRADEAEGITRADMVKAADDTLKLLKADHLQAVIVAHTDTRNPHVHVILNRVDPNTGKLATFTQDFSRLDRWAAQYERDRGMIVTPRRQAKEQGREENPDPAKRREYIKERNETRKRKLADRTPQAAQEGRGGTPRPQSPAAALKARGDAQRAAHAQAWAKLSADQKARRKAIYEAVDQGIKERLRTAREVHRPFWAELHKAQRDERKRYDARERRLSGIVANAIDAVRSRQIRGDGSDRGFLTMAFSYLASRDARRAELDARQLAEREQLAAATKNRTNAEIQKIKEARAATLAQSREICAKEAAALKASQAKETLEIRAAWKAIYQQREQARATEGRERQERQPRESRPRIRLQTKDARRETRAAWLEETTRRADVSRRFAESRHQGDRPADQERQAMRREFDKAHGLRPPEPPARPVPTRTVSLSTPTPAPSPAGDVPAVNRKPAQVPAIDKAAATIEAARSAPTVRKDWRQSAAPAPAPASVPAKDWGQSAPPSSQAPAARKDWGTASQDRPREIKPLPERNKDRDFER